jgi:hypothetical protein
MSELFELIREDFATANKVWEKSEVLAKCLSFLEEEDDEEEGLVEVQSCCYLSVGYVDGPSAIYSLGRVIDEISQALHTNKREALRAVESLIDDLGGMVEFVEANSGKLEYGECESVDAARFLYDMIFYMERIRGNLRALICR